ncbi:hypothetical protein CS542_01385 [Pedobacter sp. IW39]|nr:hypothetical protein CS542_01385 [Pedobacter sp. IW39]
MTVPMIYRPINWTINMYLTVGYIIISCRCNARVQTRLYYRRKCVFKILRSIQNRDERLINRLMLFMFYLNQILLWLEKWNLHPTRSAGFWFQ